MIVTNVVRSIRAAEAEGLVWTDDVVIYSFASLAACYTHPDLINKFDRRIVWDKVADISQTTFFLKIKSQWKTIIAIKISFECIPDSAVDNK